jgi:RND family efflux transporter MFP subunit
LKRTGIALVLAIMGMLLAGCEQQRAAAPATPPKPAGQAAAVVAEETSYVASGPLVVEHQVDLAAERAGVVAKILVQVGARVHKGQVLAELDARQLQADRAAAEAHVSSSQFELQHWQAETQVRQSDLDRDEAMYQAKLITDKQVEHSRYSVAGAKFETQREVQNLRNAQESLRSLELELEKTRITAPFDGVVARRYVREGQRLALNDRVFWVTALAPIRVKFTVPQEFAGKLKTGEEVAVSSPAQPERMHPARITLVSPVVDPASGTLEIEAQLVGTSPDLLPGMTVNVRVPKPR